MSEEHFEREGFCKYIVFPTLAMSHDLRMLAENQIEGVLTHELRNINGKVSLYYHIEGCQPISVVYAQKAWDYIALKNLFRNICSCISMLREYLLPYDSLLLDAEHIYWSWQQERARFIVAPECNMPIQEQITMLVEYLMQHVDYQDQRASDWLYRLYDALRKEGASYELLCEYCAQEVRREMVDSPPEKAMHECYDKETRLALQEMYYMEESKWSRAVSKLVSRAKCILKKRDEKQGGDMQTEMVVQPVFCDNVDISDVAAFEDVEMQVDNETTLLTEGEASIRLKPLDAGYPDIVPRKERTLIGRQEGACNHVLACQDVSRVHASVVLKDKIMVVTDLNSSNGTYVNQRRINIQEDVAVECGDEVCFGSVKYVAV